MSDAILILTACLVGTRLVDSTLSLNFSQHPKNEIQNKMQHEAAPLYPSATLPLMKDNSSAVFSPLAPLQTPGTVPHLLLGPENTVTTCPFCHASIKTAVKYTTTTRTHIAAVLYGLMCCCCCIGYCSDSAKNSDHYCPNCQRFLGTYQK